jgi:gamma-glutamyl-gamma-aminobutyrate hydrolase PuuD
MAKKGMKRPERTHTEKRNNVPPVPEIQGKAKSGKTQANPIIAGTNDVTQKVYHTKPYKKEKTISDAYQAIDTDLARDNLENDIPFADLQDN